MKKSILILIVAFISMPSFGQFGMKKRIEELKELKSRPLIVSTEYEKVSLDDLKSAVEENWTFNSDVSYLPYEELLKLKENETEAEKYSYLVYSIYAEQYNYPLNSIRVGLLEEDICAHFQMLSNDPLKTSRADVIFGVQRLQDIIEGIADYKKMSKKEYMKIINDNNSQASQIKSRKLLIDKSVVDSNKKLLKVIEKKYNYDYEIVSKETIDKVILDKSSDVYYLKGLIAAKAPVIKSSLKSIKTNATGATYRHDLQGTEISYITYSIYDPVNGEPLYNFILKGVSFGAPTDLKAKDFENFIKIID